ncbi:MAG: sensor histidine kinase [Flammeovirgaceae bacterium]
MKVARKINQNIKQNLLKYGFRIVAACMIFIFFKAMMEEDVEGLFTFDKRAIAYLTFTFTMVLGMWEVTDAVFCWVSNKAGDGPVRYKGITQYLIICIFITVVLAPFIAYLDVYGLAGWLNCPIGDLEVAYYQSCVGSMGVGTFMTVTNLVHHFIRYEKQVEVFQEQLKQSEILSKYESLKNQINPHFLFNSFSVLTSLIYKDQDMAADFTTQLSKIYRYVLENKEKDLVTLKEEVQFIRSFFFLLKIRHAEAMHMNISLSVRTGNTFIPPLALQMLVENAIKHNSFTTERPLYIEIFNDTEGYLVVQNNIQKRVNPPESTHVGLKNIKERYALHTHEALQIECVNHLFRVRIPMLSGNTLKYKKASQASLDSQLIYAKN